MEVEIAETNFLWFSFRLSALTLGGGGGGDDDDDDDDDDDGKSGFSVKDGVGVNRLCFGLCNN